MKILFMAFYLLSYEALADDRALKVVGMLKEVFGYETTQVYEDLFPAEKIFRGKSCAIHTYAGSKRFTLMVRGGERILAQFYLSKEDKRRTIFSSNDTIVNIGKVDTNGDSVKEPREDLTIYSKPNGKFTINFFHSERTEMVSCEDVVI